MSPLMSRSSVGRKAVGQVQQPMQPIQPMQAPMGQQQAQGQPVWQQQTQQGQVYQQQPMQQPVYQQGQQQQPVQQPVYQQQPIQQPVFQQGQKQQPMFQQPLQQQVNQQPVYQQQGQQQAIQQRPVQQQPVYQQQAPQQPVYHQQIRQQPVQQYQQAQQQSLQQRPIQQFQQPIQQLQQPQQPLQQRTVQQQPVQQQPAQQYQQPIQQQPTQQPLIQQQPVQQLQQPIQQRVVQQQPVQQPIQQPIQQQSISQRMPTPSNTTTQAANQQIISSAASVRSVGSVASSHTNPSQTFGSPASFPASISQHASPSYITCSLCTTDISNDSTHLECLACTSAQTPTLFCTQCCISKSPVPNHRHPMSNFVSASDIITFDPEVSVHGWDVRKSAIGITWYHHKGSKIKTLQKPKPLTPVTQPPVFRADSNLPDGWEEIKDPDGRLFYYHRATKVSKWTRPQNNQLAAGWTECTNPDGRTYYLNTITQATTWDRPVGSSPAANDERKSVTSAKSTFPDTTEWSPNDKRQSISSQGQSTATPQSPASIRSSTILETVEWSPTDIEKTTVPAHRAASVPNIVPTTTWTPSEPTLRPIPTRAETQPQYGEWQYDQSGHRQHSRTFSKEALASGSATATKAVVKSTKTAANATAKGVKSAAKKLKESKNAQRIVAGVGMAAVNSVLINQFGISIPTSVGTAAVGLVNAIDFEETTAVVDVTNADVVEDDDVGDNVTDNVDVSGYMNQGSTPDGSGDAVDVNQMNTMPGNDYVVGGENAVVETTTIVPEEIIIMPAAPLPMVQQPQPILSAGSYSGPQHINPSAPQHAAPGPIPGSADWEFSNMQRPAAMIASHIPIRYPARPNQGVFASAPASGMQTQKGPIHPGAGQHQNPSGQGHGNFGYAAQSHIPVHVQHAAPIQNQPHQQAPNQVHNPGLSQASHQPQWANQPQIHPQQPQAHQAPRPQQGQMPNQQHIPQGNTPNQQQSPQYQMPNKPQGQFPNPGHAQATQNQNSNQQQRPPGNSNQKKPLLKPHQKAALMNAGMKIGTSLLKSAIRSSMSGNSDGNDYDYNDNDNSFDSTDNSNFDMRDSDFSNDTGNGFDTNDNFDNGMVDGDTQGQDQDQFTDANQQFDNSFNGNSYDAGNYVDTTDYGGNNQFVGSDNTSDNTGDANVYDGSTIDTQGMNTPGFDDTLSAQGGFNIPPNTTYDQQSDINQQAQGILPAPMSDDNAAMNGFFTTPDTTYNDPSAIYLQGQGVLQTSMSDDNAAMNGFFTTPDMTCNDPSDINLQGQGILQASMEDGNTAMNGVSSGPDTTFSQDAMSDSNGSVETNMAAASNFWTVDVPDTSTSQTTGTSQAYAGLTSASLSGPMTDYYDSFSSFGGDIPLDQDTEQGPTTPVNPSGSIQNGGFFQDSTLTSADQEVSSSLDQSTDMSTTPDVSLDQDLQSMNQSLDQSQDPTTDPTSQDGSIPNTPPEFPSTIPPTNLTPNTVAAGTISQLYDGSGYGNSDSESAGNTPVDTQPMTPPVGMAATKIAGPAVTVMPVMPLTPPAMPTMPTPDPMADPSLLVIGQ